MRTRDHCPTCGTWHFPHLMGSSPDIPGPGRGSSTCNQSMSCRPGSLRPPQYRRRQVGGREGLGSWYWQATGSSRGGSVGNWGPHGTTTKILSACHHGPPRLSNKGRDIGPHNCPRPAPSHHRLGCPSKMGH